MATALVHLLRHLSLSDALDDYQLASFETAKLRHLHHLHLPAERIFGFGFLPKKATSLLNRPPPDHCDAVHSLHYRLHHTHQRSVPPFAFACSWLSETAHGCCSAEAGLCHSLRCLPGFSSAARAVG